MKEFAKRVYGCFRCGEMMGESSVQSDGYVKCGSCGEISILSFEQALDLLNNIWLDGHVRFFSDYSTEELLEELLTIPEEDLR